MTSTQKLIFLSIEAGGSSIIIRDLGTFYLFLFLFLAQDSILKVISWFKVAPGASALTYKFQAAGKMGRGKWKASITSEVFPLYEASPEFPPHDFYLQSHLPIPRCKRSWKVQLGTLLSRSNMGFGCKRVSWRYLSGLVTVREKLFREEWSKWFFRGMTL